LKVLVIGNGGREHAIIWKLAKSPQVDKIYCAPGNAGIDSLAECVNVEVEDFIGLLKIVHDKKIDLTIVGPEIPLSLGIVNLFQEHGYPIFGPTREAAEIESSKVFAKYLMNKYSIPTAGYKVFDDDKKAISYSQKQSFPLAIKADGLAAGKGVFIAENFNQAEEAITHIMKERKYGQAGNKIIIEEYLAGEEVSMLVFSDGINIVPMITSQDHKKLNEGDKGPNTGGMGAYSPVAFFEEDTRKWVLEHVFKPAISGMAQEGRIFKGVLYAGLILTSDGPKVLEFNARFGDPETQVILPSLKTDLIQIIQAVINGNLDKVHIEWIDQASACVVLASAGYPGEYEKGKTIHGLEKLADRDDIIVFHAGTKKDDQKIITAGGRVLGVTSWADNLSEAIKSAYDGLEQIEFENKYYRKDIGKKGL